MIDKNELYGTFNKSIARNVRLQDMATRKALDLPYDEGFKMTVNKYGASIFATVAATLATLAIGAGGAGLFYYIYSQKGEAAKPAAEAEPDKKEFTVKFFDDEGKPIEVIENE